MRPVAEHQGQEKVQQREGMAQQGEEMAQEGVEESLDEKQAPGAVWRTLVALVEQICEISSLPVQKKTRMIYIRTQTDRKHTI